MVQATILDYGIGNILSVKRVFEYFEVDVKLTDSPKEVVNAELLILPGVGAFEDGMNGLAERQLIEPIREYATKGRPFLGICLGMQMMLEQSEEFGLHQGLGLIPGKVVEIDKTTISGEPHKIPHIGWNELIPPEGKERSWWENSILAGIPEKSSVYFVHSFTAVPSDNEHRLADTYYGGRLISAVIRKDHLFGCQFHPEKSGEVGLQIIKEFIAIAK